MAGIGFDLKKIFYSSSDVGKIKVTFQSFFVSSGPLIFSIVTTLFLKLINETFMNKKDFNTFTGVMIYSFVFGIILSNPINCILTRKISDILYEKKYNEILSYFFTGFLVIGMLSFLVGFVYIESFSSLSENSFRISYLFASLNLLWFVMTFVTMLRETHKITFAYLTGMFIIVTVNYFYDKGSLAHLIDFFLLGICFTLFYLSKLIISRFEFNHKLIFSWIFDFKYYPIFISGFFLYAGMWIDKIIYWFFSNNGIRLLKGFYFFPCYDFVVFLGYITIIPATAYFIVFIETEFFENQKKYLSLLKTGGSLNEIKNQENNLYKIFNNSILKLISFQFFVSISFILILLPVMKHYNFAIKSLPLLGISTIDAFMQIIFNVLIIFFYYFDFQKECVFVTFLFFGLNFFLTWMIKDMPYKLAGYSYFYSLLIGNTIAYLLLRNKLKNLTFYILVKNL